MKGHRVPRALALAVALATTLVAGCSPPPAPELVNHPPPPVPTATTAATAAVSPAPPAPAPTLPPVQQRRRYVGFRCGLAYRERGTGVRLPEGLTLVRAVHTAVPVHLIVAQRGEDLVTLLLDEGGVVVDSVEIVGAAAAYQLVPGCSAGADDVDIALIARVCKGPVTASRAWNGRAGKLEAAGAPVTCVCDA